MTAIKNIVSLFMIALFFLTSSGIVLHHHYCKKEGETTRFFLPVEHLCSQEVELPTCDVSQCCKSQGNNENQDEYPFAEKESCCSDATEFIHLDEDYTTTESDSRIYKTLFSQPFAKLEISESKLFFSSEKGRAPPLILTQDTRLAFLQIYLI
jgi:hypothetical protein